MSADTLIAALMCSDAIQILSGRGSGRSACWTFLMLGKIALDNKGALLRHDGNPATEQELCRFLHMGDKWFAEDLAILISNGLVERSPETGVLSLPLFASLLNESDASNINQAARATLRHEPPRISEADFRMYFSRMRACGARDASEEIQADFWNYLVLADFRKTTGERITKQNVASTFIVWRRLCKARASEEEARMNAIKQAAEREVQRQQASERVNDRILRSEEETNWDEE